MSGLGKPIAFHAVRKHYRPSRAYWIAQAIGGWTILTLAILLFIIVGLVTSLFTADRIAITVCASVVSLRFMVDAYRWLYRFTLTRERRRLGLED